MSLFISPEVHQKLATIHLVTQDEIEQCFMNHDGPYLTDAREAHATDPPTLWFIGETDAGRQLKVVFVPEHGNLSLRTAFRPSPIQAQVYFDATARHPDKNRWSNPNTRSHSMNQHERIPASDEAWESGELGDDPKFARVHEGDIQLQINEAIAMRPISIRAAGVADRDVQAARTSARPGLSAVDAARAHSLRGGRDEARPQRRHRRTAACRRGYGERRRDAAGRDRLTPPARTLRAGSVATVGYATRGNVTSVL